MYTTIIMMLTLSVSTIFFFFFNDTATTEIYTLSLHDALPILRRYLRRGKEHRRRNNFSHSFVFGVLHHANECEKLFRRRSEEHTSELQSQSNLVCRLLLEKKKKKKKETLHLK